MSKKCGCCQQELDESCFHYDAQTITNLSCYCRNCMSIKAKKDYNKRKQDHNFKVRYTLNASKARARKRDLEHTLTLEELNSLFPQDMVCPVFGFTMQWGNPKWSSPSLDRIDSTKGYTLDNCQIISNKANKLKNDATLQELKDLVNYLEDLF